MEKVEREQREQQTEGDRGEQPGEVEREGRAAGGGRRCATAGERNGERR